MKKVTEGLSRKQVFYTSKILLMKLIPALIEEDLVEFGEALTLFEKEVGRMFRSVQGDIFRHEVIRKGINFLLKKGVFGAGQSSWGPSFYGLIDEFEKANKICLELKQFLNKHGGGIALVTSADNSGALIKLYED